MKSVLVVIRGTNPLLQHRFGEAESQPSSTRRGHVDRGTPRDEAEKCAYRDKEGHLWLPGAAISRLLREAGGSHKQTGSRKSMKHVVPAAVRVGEDTIPLYKPESEDRLDTFEVDSRPVTIPATKGRIMRHRPRLEEWEARFSLKINDSLIDERTVHKFLVEGGDQIGVGDFRPEKGGPFGTFMVTTWAPLDDQKAKTNGRPAKVSV